MGPQQGLQYGVQPNQTVPLQSPANYVEPGANVHSQAMMGGPGIQGVIPSKRNDGGVEVQRSGNIVAVSHKAYPTAEEQVQEFSSVVTGIETINGHTVKVQLGNIDTKIDEALNRVVLIDTYFPEEEMLDISSEVIRT